MLWLILYILVIFGLSFIALRHNNGSDAFFVNNRESTASAVALSIVASCVGGSATIGVAGLAWEVGTPAFWWLGTGALGLIILTIFLAKKVRESNARTMPEMVGTFIGPKARGVTSIIIVLAWLSITAAQFSAMAAIISPLAGIENSSALWISSFIVITYACIGGQSVIIKSDAFQFIILILALVLALAFLLIQRPDSFQSVPFEILNADFPLSRFSYFLCILGGSYIVCPMLFGRLLSAKDSKHAKRGAWLAVGGLCFSAALIVALGIACRGLVPQDIPAQEVLSTVVLGHLPPWAGHLVLLGLFSAIISSADSCLITAATVFSNDILRHSDTFMCRICLILIGLGGLVLANSGKGVLQLLLMANDIYVCGVVAPVFIGMLFYKRFIFQHHIILAAIILGGLCGLTSSITEDTTYSYVGLVISIVISLLAMRQVKKA